MLKNHSFIVFILFFEFVQNNQNNQNSQPFQLYPVILVPGDGGNQLYAKLNKTTAPNKYCDLITDKFVKLWLNLKELLPFKIDCLVDNMRLIYDPLTKLSNDNSGVTVKIKGFGNLDEVEYIDSSSVSISSYFAHITDYIVKTANYTRNLNIRGAPYDWRKAPNELDEFYKNLTNLVEETYHLNNSTKVIFIAHSMGNPVLLYWLNKHVNLSWKEKFIKKWISLSGVWGGTVKTVRLMASGDSLNTILLNPYHARTYQRSAVSTAFLMPSDKFWSENETILSRPLRNYTVKDYKQFFNDINFPIGYEMRRITENLIDELIAPDVELHCLYGVNMKTPEKLIFTKESEFPDSQPSVIYGDGDGSVNLRSLLGYKKWIGKQLKPILYKEFDGVEHAKILKFPKTIDYIFNLLLE